jgi:LPXTG-motif cell wall-anchored protein
MKNSLLYIVGATVLVGGAFLFLKNKKKKDLLKLAEAEKLAGATSSGTTTGGTTSGGIAVSKINEVLQVPISTKNTQEAVTLASQIFELKNKKNKYSNMSLSDFYKTPESKGHFSFGSAMGENLRQKVLKDFDNQLKILNDKIVTLGFIEVNGSIAKLN